MKVERMLIHFMRFSVHGAGARLKVLGTRVEHAVAPFFDSDSKRDATVIKIAIKTKGYLMSSLNCIAATLAHRNSALSRVAIHRGASTVVPAPDQ
jgi:hypothetical protein